jgi:hypothetical protein
MAALRTTPRRAHPRVRSPERPSGFVRPLPPRRERRQVMPLGTGGEWETWWGREVHPDVPGPLRHVAVLVLWLVVVMALMLLFAQMAH